MDIHSELLSLTSRPEEPNLRTMRVFGLYAVASL
jgi:hypothetical protein